MVLQLEEAGALPPQGGGLGPAACDATLAAMGARSWRPPNAEVRLGKQSGRFEARACCFITPFGTIGNKLRRLQCLNTHSCAC